MDMRNRKLWIGLTAAVLVVALMVTAGFLWHRQEQQQLVDLRNEALEKLKRDQGQYDEQSIVLNGTSKAKAEKLAELYGAELRITKNGRFATLTLPEGTTIRDVYAMGESLKHIEEMAADYQVQISEIEVEEESGERLPMRPQYSVSDSDYELQTYLDYLNMGNVWNNYQGNGITVAVIDTGIDTDHPEFAGRISEYSYNATEDKIVKDWNYDWSLIEDEQGHGTAVTGVIAASMNGSGIVGIAPNVNILVIKAECDENGKFARTSDLVFGLYYAIERDVQVVNMSFGTYSPVNPFAEAVQLAYDSDVICVAAAGNENTSSLCWPAADENVIGVGALGDGWELANYSNYGENTNLVAPGSTYTCKMGGGYATTQGTSLASPIVAGAIALYMQTDKYTTFDRVAEILYASCYDLGDLGRDWYYGFGALDISAFILEQRGKIIYDMLTDELENEEGIYIQGHTLQELPEPERLYAVFDGWYYDDTFTQEYDYYVDKFYGEEITLYAKWANEDDGVPYTYVILDDGTVEIRSYTGHRRYITIPEKIDGRIVSSIGDFAFAGQSRLREITLPSGLRHIGLSAFSACSNLISIQIPANVIEIEDKAFKDNVRLTTIAFPGNSKLESIGDFAFQNCGKLERIELPAPLKTINGSAFFGATSLHSITVQNGNTAFQSLEGVLFNLGGSTLVAFPASHGTSYALPGQTMGIGAYAFGFAGLKEIQLTNVESIGASAFAYAALETLTLPDSVTNMAEGAFAYNTKLAKVTIGRGLTQISKEAFVFTTSLNTITIPNGITLIGGAAFSSSGLTSVVFEENSSLMLIDGSAFFGCNISEIDIPASVLEIGESAFVCNPLIRIGFTDNAVLRTIGKSAFAMCWLLENIDLPTSLRTIGGFAFQSSGLTEATIPAGVTTIGEGAFSLCSDLTKVEVEAGNTVYHDIDGVVYTLDNTAIHTYPAGKAGESYTLQNTTQIVAPWAFAGAVNLTTVTLPESLTQISEYGFAYCDQLSHIHIPDKVLQIGRYAFAEDWNLQSVTFNETAKLPRISFGSFAYCGLTDFRLPANVSTMAQGAFMGCKNLTSFTFAANSKLESISAYMFDGCTNLRTITFEQGSALTSIQAHGLEGMDKLTAINFGDAKLTNVDNFAFRFCESLSVLNLPETVTNIGRYAFYGCKSLAELTIPKNVEHIGSYAFLATKDIDLYFVSETLPAYLDENWDHGTKGYYTGVTSVKEAGNWKYAILESGSIAILKYNGEEAHVDLTKLNLGAPVTIIGGSAFEDSSVQTIVLPDTLTAIQAEAFAYSDLTAIAIPAAVTFIGREAFAYTDITALTFAAGSKLSVMEQYAFAGTKQLTAVILPKSLKTMCTGVFAESGLQSVTFEQGIQITEIPQKAFTNTKLTKVILPDSVTLVNHNAFNNVQTLKSVAFGKNEGIRLMTNAFYHTGLTSLHIPANVTYIGEYCFVALPNLQAFSVDENNPNYKAVDGLLLNKSGRKLIAVPAGRTGSLTVPEGVEEIGFGAFEETKLSQINFLPNANILTFGYRAFFKAENITGIAIPKSVVSIDYYAFAYCENLQTVTFAEDNQLKGIYEGAFLGCINLENITIPDTIVEISDFAFYGCSKIDQLPISENNQIKGIYDYAFAYTGLKGEFTTPESLWDIGNYAFLGCNFTKVTIPDTNKKILIIGIGAFEDCNQLTEITLPFIGASYEDEVISWFGYIFGAGTYEANAVYVPKSLKRIAITGEITFAGVGAFYGMEDVSSFELPASITDVYYGAFQETTGRYELKGVVTIHQNEYMNQNRVTSRFFGMGISGTIELAEGVQVIDSNAFYECINLESVILPDSVIRIENAFMYCYNLRNIHMGHGVQIIHGMAFYECVSLNEITIPASVTTIGNMAFFNCRNLLEIYNQSELEFTFGSDEYGGIAKNARYIKERNGNERYADQNANYERIDTKDGFRFIRENGIYKLVTYFGAEETVTLPTDVNGAEYVISRFEGAKHVIIPEGRTKIDNNAFVDSTMLTSISIPESVTVIGSNAFQRCKNLKKVKIPDSVKNIGTFAFEACENLEEVTLPENGVKIGYMGFAWSGIKCITIPVGVDSIGGGAFEHCNSLIEVRFEEGVTSVGTDMFAYCEKLSAVFLAESITSIASGAFNGCISLAEVTLPTGLKEMGASAFSANTALKIPDSNQNFKMIDGILYDKQVTKILSVTNAVKANVVLPGTLTSIGQGAFVNCDNIETIVIPESVRTIENWAFEGCTNLKSVDLPKGVSLGWGVFRYCSSLENIKLPNVQYIGTSMFEECKNLKNIELPDTLQEIEAFAFAGCSSLEAIIIPDSVTVIGDYAFSRCVALKTVKLSKSLNMIGPGMFSYCHALERVEIPDAVKQISQYAFSRCTGLQEIVLPQNLQTIEKYAFENCDSLMFVYNRSGLSLAVGSTENGYITYYALRVFDKDGKVVSEDGNVQIIDEFVFTVVSGKYTLKAYIGKEETVTLPLKVNGNPYNIYRLKGIKHLIVPEGVRTIDKEAFAGNQKLESVKLPSSLLEIGERAFEECINLKTIEIPNSVTTIGEFAFHNCSNLISATLPQGLRMIGRGMFDQCYKLSSITIPNSVTEIQDYAFRWCRSLENVHWGEGIVAIGAEAFYDCEKLKSINIPSTVKRIEKTAFDGTALYQNPDCWINGMLVIDGCLVAVREDLVYMTNMDQIRVIADDAYEGCYMLKSMLWYPEWGGWYWDVILPSNVQTIYIMSIRQATPNLQNIRTLKNVVICNTVSASDLRHCQQLFTYDKITGVTIYVEALEADLRWGDNFPGWNNGNVVVYGDKWNYAEFYDADGNLLSSEPKRNAEIIRRPVVQLPANTESDRYELLGWDLDGDGIADSIPATTATDIRATAIIHKIHTHYYNAVVTAPTCTAKGYTTHTCACGDTYTDSEVAATGHKDGNKDHICDNGCGVYQGTHTDGDDADHKCDYGCGATLSQHSYSFVVTAPTCTAKGYTTHTCVCGHSYTDSEVAATGHKDSNKDHICDNGCGIYQGIHTDGNDADHLCDYGCGATLSQHNYTSVITVPTCTEKGYTTYTCICGDTYVADELPAAGHQPGAEATCTTSQYCTVCGITLVTAKGHTDANEDCVCDICGTKLCTNHTEETIPGLAATCEQTGLTDGKRCSVCGEILQAQEVIPANGHSYVAMITPPTCTTAGYTNYTCVCGNTYTDDYVDAVGHHYGEWTQVKAPTTEESGMDERSCEACEHKERREVATLDPIPTEPGKPTQPSEQPQPSEPAQPNGGTEENGIDVGVIVGCVLAIFVAGALVYLFVIKKKP